MLVFHKHLAQHIRNEAEFFENQYAFQKNSHMLAKREIQHALESGQSITTIDLKNAFNSVPFEIVEQAMSYGGLPPLFAKYVKTFMVSRRSNKGIKIRCGVP